MTGPSKTDRCGAARQRWRRAAVSLTLMLAAAALPAHAFPADAQAENHLANASRLIRDGDLREAEAELRRAVDLVADNPTYLARLGQVLGMQNSMEEAARYYRQALKLAPDSLAIRRNLALTQWSRRRFAEAKANLEQVLARVPEDELTRLLLGMILVNSGEYARAVSLLESVPEQVRGKGDAVAALARAQYGLGKREQARTTLESMALNRSLPPNGVYACATVAANAEDFATAEKLFLSIRSTYPDAAALSYQIALMQFRSNRIDRRRRTLLEAIERNQGSGPIHNLLGHCHAARNRLRSAVASFEQAMAAFQTAIGLNPAEEANYLDLVHLLADESLLDYWLDASRGPRLRWHLALQALDRGVEKLPASARLFETRGFVQAKLDYTREAIQSYARALELDPGSAKASLDLGVAQRLAGRTRDAGETFERGIRRFPLNASFYQEYGLLLAKAGDSGDEAARSRSVALLRKALEIDASLVEPHYQLGQLALAQGNPEEAARHFETAVRLAPRESKLRYGLVRAYRRLGRQQQAREQAGKYRQLKAAEDAEGTPP